MSRWRYEWNQHGWQDRYWHGWNQRSSGLWDRGCSRGFAATSDGWQDAMRLSSSGNGVAAVAAGDTANENGVAAVADEDTSLVQPCDIDLHQQVTAAKTKAPPPPCPKSRRRLAPTPPTAAVAVCGNIRSCGFAAAVAACRFEVTQAANLPLRPRSLPLQLKLPRPRRSCSARLAETMSARSTSMAY